VILNGDSLTVLGGIKPESVDMCMTSPPYWGLRDYGHPNQLGLEPTPELYIEHMTEIFHEVRRVLKKGGTLWLNIGDTYSASKTGSFNWDNPKGQHPPVVRNTRMDTTNSVTPKCLCMIPERLAWSLIQDGWILRNKIIWYKPNGMPSSVKDRFSNKWEYLFMFSKQQKYSFDLDGVRDDYSDATLGRVKYGYTSNKKEMTDHAFSNKASVVWSKRVLCGEKHGKNPGDVFTIPTCPFPEAHFAVFPEKLCEKPIKAGCPEGGVVLDPFCGSGTVGVVAKEQGKKFIGIDVKHEYCKMAQNRIAKSGYQLIIQEAK